MIRMNCLRNLPVICNNRQIGFLHGVKLNDEQNGVCALVIARGLKGKCVLLTDDVTMISSEFIIARRTHKYERRYEKQNICFVYDTDGLMIGKVSDYALDEENWRIAAIEVMRSYLPSGRRERIWFFQYSSDENRLGAVIVPAFLYMSQSERKEE